MYSLALLHLALALAAAGLAALAYCVARALPLVTARDPRAFAEDFAAVLHALRDPDRGFAAQVCAQSLGLPPRGLVVVAFALRWTLPTLGVAVALWLAGL